MPLVKYRKVVMLGYPAVGKSSLAVQFIHGEFRPAYEPTIEQTWHKNFFIGTEEFDLDVVDTAGQDQYSLVPLTYTIGIHGYVVVYSVSCARSFEIAGILYKTLVDKRGKCRMPIILVGNKTDLAGQTRKIKPEEGKKLADSWGAAFMEASAKDPEKCKQVFIKIIQQIDHVERSFSDEKKCCTM